MTENIDVAGEVRAPLRELGEQLSHVWWTVLVVGIVTSCLGLAILATDWTVHALTIITGVLFVIRGLALALSPTYAVASSGEQVLAGVLGLIAGIVLIAFPHPSLLLLAFFVGAWLTVSGTFQIVVSFARRRELRQWGLTLAVGVVELLLGVWAMRRPEVTLSLLIDLIGLWAVITGALLCALGFEVRHALRPVTRSFSRTSEGVQSLTDRLDVLGRLHDNGMLSSAEYMQLKAALLGDVL
ncbi:MAG TPA: DUF308 domain-containing protein [Mycobacteriales bacterium]|jgi:uncharacterized membrane protein HdeD (DUF308 family)|nr:DUF308 domain-containing protein [Mycobacteriales bacterium]